MWTAIGASYAAAPYMRQKMDLTDFMPKWGARPPTLEEMKHKARRSASRIQKMMRRKDAPKKQKDRSGDRPK